MKGCPFKKLFNILVRGKKYQSKIGTFENKIQNWSFINP
jgi:hypothetical protein